MRRKDKEISNKSGIETIIKNAKVCRLGMINGDKP
jgi:nitroimidazol reductase NimA-like FMN-containing flavoprotein (pyridoxamine 5'-phosphate oxidase superfamily)